jgi:hypothetical protein
MYGSFVSSRILLLQNSAYPRGVLLIEYQEALLVCNLKTSSSMTLKCDFLAFELCFTIALGSTVGMKYAIAHCRMFVLQKGRREP